jgi:hypothetical protein
MDGKNSGRDLVVSFGKRVQTPDEIPPFACRRLIDTRNKAESRAVESACSVTEKWGDPFGVFQPVHGWQGNQVKWWRMA